jgi:general secretion pathway protein J
MASRGFTLIELLISMTIIGVVLVLVMGAFRLGINAWEKGEENIEVYQRQQIVLELVKKQLASIRRTKITTEDSSYYFKGDESSVEFVSAVSIVPTDRKGDVLVRYRIRQDGDEGGLSLFLHETTLAAADPDDSGFEPDEDTYHLLVGGMSAVNFSFLAKEEGPGSSASSLSWQPVWDPEVMEPELPEAVRFTLQAGGKDPAVGVVARVTAEAFDG